MMRKLLLPLTLVCLLLYACDQEEISIPEPHDQDDLKNEEVQTRAVSNKGYFSLGVSYDVTEEYLGRKSTKHLVVDVEAFLRDNQSVLSPNNATYINQHMYSGADTKSFTEEITKKLKTSATGGVLGISWLPSANITYDSDTKNTHTHTTKYAYSRVDHLKIIKKLTLNTTPQELINYVYPSFLQHLDAYTPDLFVSRYGTHVLLDGTFGGRMKFNYRSEIYEEENKSEKKRIVDAGATAVIEGASIELKGDLTNKRDVIRSKKNAYWETTVECFGGEESGIGTLSFNSDTGIPSVIAVNFAQWEKSVTEKNAELLDVDWNYVYPIYEFIADPVKKAQIKAAVQRHIAKNPLKTVEVTPLYRLHQKKANNTWFTGTLSEANYYIGKWGYYLDWGEEHYVLGYMFKTRQPGTVPVYRLHNGNTFLTTSLSEANTYISKWKYYFDTGQSGYILGYVYENREPLTRPLYRLYHKKGNNSWFTSSLSEANHYIRTWGYAYDPSFTNYIQGYLIPTDSHR